MTRLEIGSRRWLAIVSIGAIVAAAPVLPDASLIPGFANAFAAGGNGGGNGGGSGNGGGNAGGNANGGGNAGNSGHNTGPGQAGRGAISNATGALNAAHASPQALANAAPGSRVGQVAAYDRAMLAALGMPGTTPAELASRMLAISAARAQLATASGKSLTPAVVARVDRLLGLPSTDPALGLR